MSERELDCEVVSISPAAARDILDGNNRNRSLRPEYVKQLAGAMDRGEWMLNGEPIQVAEDGTLLNGQHRLSAVVESGATVPMLLIKGLPLTAQKTMDVGTRRSISDTLALHGEKDTTNLGAVLGLLYRYRLGVRLDYTTRTAPTVRQALDLLDAEPQVRIALFEARKVFQATRMRLSVAALFLYLFEEIDPGQGKAFFELLCDPSELAENNPVRVLRGHLDRIHAERNHRFSTYLLSAVTIKSFNAWREGREVGVLAFRPGGAKPEPFPKIATPAHVEGR